MMEKRVCLDYLRTVQGLLPQHKTSKIGYMTLIPASPTDEEDLYISHHPSCFCLRMKNMC